MKPEIDQLTGKGVLNGECPIWNPETGRLLWVDIRGSALHEYDPTTGEDHAWEMPSWTGACYLMHGAVALTMRGGLFGFDAGSGSLRFLAGPPYDARRLTFNDGRCDRQGRLYCGMMVAPLAPTEQTSKGTEAEGGPLWRLEGGGKWSPVTDPVRTSNGLAWSPDGRTMYHADTRQKTVWAYDYDPETGWMANKREFVRVDIPGASGPDGASVDRDGFYWVAVYGGGCVLRFDPAGKLERRIDMPCRYPTMPTFGGVGLDEIYVTSANHSMPEAERAARPQEGALFRMKAPVPGLPEPVFDAKGVDL